MPRKTLISEIMTREVVTIDVLAQMSEVREILTTEKFHHLPVMDGERLVGIISSRDLIRATLCLASTAPEGWNEALDRSTSTKETMQTELYTMRADETVDRAIDLLASGERHSLLIVDQEEEALVGIVTNIDVLEFLFD